MKTEKKYLISAFGVIVLSIFLMWVTTDNKRNNATYTIVSGNERTYYAYTFRMYGKGITFDDVYGKKIILMGDIDIQYKSND
jgi:hypothetical protein